MAPKVDKTGQIVKPAAAGDGLARLVQSLSGEIARALPRHLSGDRMSRIVLTALRTTPRLSECTPTSFAGCVMSLAQLGLEPNTPLQHAYLIPRQSRGKNAMECTALIGYQGMIELSRRSGLIDDIYAEVVRDCDRFRWQLGTDPRVEHEPAASGRQSADITHAYAVAFVRGAGRPAFRVLDRDEIDSRRSRSQGASSAYSPWATDYAEMARKTAVRALWKFLPKSAEMARLEEVEVAADTGRSVAEVLDAPIADALQRRGLLEADTAPPAVAPEPSPDVVDDGPPEDWEPGRE
jgi:recombination protein RecT